MSDFPGLVQFTAGDLLIIARRRQTYTENIAKWVAKELHRRRKLLRASFDSLSWWAAFREKSGACWIDAAGLLDPKAPWDTRCELGARVDDDAYQLGYSQNIDWLIADTWVRHTENLTDLQRVFVPAEAARRLTTLPNNVKFTDIPWADLRHPVQPPQPPCPIPTEEEFACNPSLTSMLTLSPAS